MNHSPISDEISFPASHADSSAFIKTVKRVTIILSLVTIAELLCGLTIYKIGHGSHSTVFMIKMLVIVFTLAKAFYITSYFMHLGDEIRNFIMTILLPLLLFVWFIIAFLWDGNSWRNQKNTQAGSKKPKIEKVQKAVKPDAKK